MISATRSLCEQYWFGATEHLHPLSNKCINHLILFPHEGTLTTSGAATPRLQWDKLNILAYKDHIFRSLDTITSVSSNNTEIYKATTHIITVLSKAASSSVPCPTTRPRNSKHKNMWSPAISAAMKHSRQAHRQWVTSGKPDPTHPASAARRLAKNVSGVKCVSKPLVVEPLFTTN